jgi:hypothetical protein
VIANGGGNGAGSNGGQPASNGSANGGGGAFTNGAAGVGRFYSGGTGFQTPNYGGGGGAGSNGTGGNGAAGIGGQGGDGSTFNITGSATCYAAGGGGGAVTPGNGNAVTGCGSGIGSSTVAGGDGQNGTGSGGGGGGNNAGVQNGGRGGDGAVVFAYATPASAPQVFLYPCNSTYNQTAVNYTFKDFLTNLPVNVTYSAAYNDSTTSGSTSGVNTTYSWCIFPTNASDTISFAENYAASGYTPISTSRTIAVSNVTTDIVITMTSSTTATATTLSLQQLPNIPLSGRTIVISQGGSIVSSCITGVAGTCLVYLTPNVVYYTYNMTGLNTTFGPEVLTCTPGSAACFRNFFVGNVIDIPGVVAGQINGNCSYSNSTYLVTCSASSTNNIVYGFGLSLYQLGAGTPVCANTTAGLTTTIMCGVPQINNSIWTYVLYSIEPTAANEPITGGEIDVNLIRAATLGRDAWFITLFLFLFTATIGAASPVLGIIFGLLGLVLAIFVGIVPFGSMNSILIISTIMGLVLVWRIRV